MFFNQSEVEFPNWWDNLGSRSEVSEDDCSEGDLSEANKEQGATVWDQEAEFPTPFARNSRVEEGCSSLYSSRSPKYDQEILLNTWEYAEIVPGNDADLWRKDEFGNWMYRLDYGNQNSEFGWEVFDPGIGRHHQGIYVLRPMQWQSYLKSYDVLGA